MSDGSNRPDDRNAASTAVSASERRPASAPAMRSGTSGSDAYGDEIGLRDLYLILRRGLPRILIAALVLGVAGYLLAALRPPAYEAHAAVTMTGTPVAQHRDATFFMEPDAEPIPPALVFVPQDGFTFDEYRTIATGRAVLEDALASVEAELDLAIAYEELEPATDIVQASQSAQANQQSPLTVEHWIVWSDPDVAAALTNAWARASVDHVRASLTGAIEPVLETTRAVAATRRAELDALEAAWLEVEDGDAAATPERDRMELQRELARARRAYLNVVDLESAAAYIAQLTPSRVRVLQPAHASNAPVGTSPRIVGTAAFLLGAMLATIFVFLREAVRDPGGTAARPEEAAAPGAGSRARRPRA